MNPTFRLFIVALAAAACTNPSAEGEGEPAGEGEGEPRGEGEGEPAGEGEGEPTGEGEGELPFAIIVEQPTPEQIALYAPLPAGFAPDAKVGVRVISGNTVIAAQPMLRIVPAWVSGGAPTPVVDAFASVVFDLSPNTDYEVELTLERPGEPTIVARQNTRTRALPPITPAANVLLTPADDVQAAFSQLAPGDVVELADGIYNVTNLHVVTSGLEQQPITIRGSSRAAILSDGAGPVLQVLDVSDVIIGT
jgi:hypothetical protein